MKFLDLFAGIGGFRLGLEQAGHTCVGFVEIDKFARKSYEAIFDTEGEYTEHDINKINTKELPEADIWCFGFPCQDISVAGKQKGFEGNRSSLFFAITKKLHELEDKKKPSYLLIENVKNLLSINSGWDFASLQIELDSLGYDIEWDILNSKEVVPQNRERVYIVGHFRGRRTRKVFPIIRENGETTGSNEINDLLPVSAPRHGRRGTVLGTDGISSALTATDYKLPKQVAVKQIGNISDSQSFGGNPQTGRVYGTDGIAPTLSTMQGGGREPKIISQNQSKWRIRKLTPRETWRLQGFPDWAFDRAEKVNSNSQLYKQAGNSVTVPVIYEIAKRMNWEED